VDLGEQTEDVLDVLEDLPRPRRIERAVGERQLLPTAHELDAKMPCARTTQRLLGNVAANRLSTVLDQRRSEIP
jgi:hypothetical protein